MKSIKRILRQTWRGCGTLPHVGEHPGTLWAVMFILCGGMAGASRGGSLWGVVGGTAFMALFVVPLYLRGAYERANLSDELTNQEKGEKP